MVPLVGTFFSRGVNPGAPLCGRFRGSGNNGLGGGGKSNGGEWVHGGVAKASGRLGSALAFLLCGVRCLGQCAALLLPLVRRPPKLRCVRRRWRIWRGMGPRGRG